MSVATRVDEVLKYLWPKEEGWHTEELRPVLAYNLRREDFEEAARRGWLEEQNGEWVFTPEGRQEASTLIRRMRLAEWLFTEVVKDPRSAEVAACRLEHVLTDEAADQICTLLGHPRTCPHGRPIPQGACCVEHRMVVRPLSLPVTHLEAGEWGKIVSIHVKSPRVRHILDTYGLHPGKAVRLVRKKPEIVVQVDHTTLVVDRDVAEEIFVRPVPLEGLCRLPSRVR